jgi:hypothetical protein
MSFSGPLLHVAVPGKEASHCEICGGRAAIELQYGGFPETAARFRLCRRHLCEVATDVPALLEELLGCLVDMVTRESERPEAVGYGRIRG